MNTTFLDLTGLKCPLPALLARKAMAKLAPGDCLEVHCTDPMSAIDIPAMVQQAGDRLDASTRNGDVLIFVIAKRNAAIADRD